MQTVKVKIALLIVFLWVAISTGACGREWSSRTTASHVVPAVSPAFPAVPLLAANDKSHEAAIRFLEERVKRDPDDFGAYNKLAGYYHQRLRETGDPSYLELAARAARASLAAMPVERNTGGLAALTLSEFSAHDFAAARDHAVQLTALDPGQSYPYGMLGDALLELGEYDKAADAYRQLERRSGGINESTETRQAHLAQLHGDIMGARLHFTNALVLALDLPAPPRETISWCRWQLGELAFAVGDYETAERHYRDALVTFPDYHLAHASLGRVRAARGDFAEAVERYERAIRRLPDPAFIAALGDLYHLAGREAEATARYALVERIGQVSALNGALYNRQLALFYADHDMKAEAAYANAAKEYLVRHDIYGADAVAWTALKAGRLGAAQAAMKEALRLGTQDAKLFYHAGMIALASGDDAAARKRLQHALELNPQFDPMQALIARKAIP